MATVMQQELGMQLQLPGTMLKINCMQFSTAETSFHNSFLNCTARNKIRKLLLKSFCWWKTDRILAGHIAISIWHRIKRCLVLNMVAMDLKLKDVRQPMIRSWLSLPIQPQMMCFFTPAVCFRRNIKMALLLPFMVPGTAHHSHRKDITWYLFLLKVQFLPE